MRALQKRPQQLTVKSSLILQMLVLVSHSVYVHTDGDGDVVEASSRYVLFSLLVWPQLKLTEKREHRRFR
jgi:hypothetical protein